MPTVDLQQLLKRAPGDRASFRSTVREWHDPAGFAKAWARMYGDEAGQMPGPEDTYEGRTDCALRLPDHAREVRGEIWAVQRGSSWWRFHPQLGLQSNEDEPGMVTNPIAATLRACVAPGHLLGPLDLEVAGDSEHTGRAAVDVRATAKDGQGGAFELSWIGWAADEWRITVDRETGIVLATSAILDGKPFRENELLDLELDPELPDELFEPLSGA
jgi:hypothetical protein